MLRVLARPALQRVIANEGDIDFPARMFASLARSAPEMIVGLPMSWLDWAMRRLRAAPESVPPTPAGAGGTVGSDAMPHIATIAGNVWL